MRKKNALRESLGLTQQEMAHLMGVSRSHLALYELGQRNLPVGASRLIDKLAVHFSSAKNISPEPTSSLSQHEKVRRKLEILLRKNEHGQIVLEQKIVALEKKEAERLQRAEMVRLLALENAETGIPDKSFINFIALKCSKKVEEKNVSELFFYRLDQERLQQDQMLIQSRLTSMSLSDNEKQ